MKFDHATAGQAFGGYPGADPRQWDSFATVMDETEDVKSVDYTEIDTIGPLVNVTLQPSGVPVACRVAAHVAGNGEGEWFPFIAGDEVLVNFPGGDAKGGAVIIARLNNGVDKFPTMVAGVDVTKNNVAFRRLRTPYILETSSSYLLRSASSTAFFSLDQKGAWTLSAGDGHYLAITEDFITLQTKDNKYLVQINLNDSLVSIEADQAKLQLKANGDSAIFVPQRLLIGTSGGSPTGHGVTAESVALFIQALLTALGALIPGPVTGAAVAASAIPLVQAAIAAGAVLPTAPILAAMQAALAIPPDPTGAKAGYGAAGLLLG